MIGYLWAGLGLLAAAGTVAIGDLASEEIRGWLDVLPHAILRLAATRLNPVQQAMLYEDEWLPELCYILRGTEARPISRLLIGMRFSLSLLTAARIVRHLYSTQPTPQIIGTKPKDPAVLAILDEIVDKISKPLEPTSYKVAPGIRAPRWGIFLGHVPITPDQLRDIYQQNLIVALDLGNGRKMLMTLSQFDEIARGLERLARIEQAGLELGTSEEVEPPNKAGRD